MKKTCGVTLLAVAMAGCGAAERRSDGVPKASDRYVASRADQVQASGTGSSIDRNKVDPNNVNGNDVNGNANTPLKSSPYRAEARSAPAERARVSLPADLEQKRVTRSPKLAGLSGGEKAVLACLVLDRDRHDLRRGRTISAQLARESSVKKSFVFEDLRGEEKLATLADRAANQDADFLLVLHQGEKRAVWIFAPKNLELLARSGREDPGAHPVLAAVLKRACRLWDAR